MTQCAECDREIENPGDHSKSCSHFPQGHVIWTVGAHNGATVLFYQPAPNYSKAPLLQYLGWAEDKDHACQLIADVLNEHAPDGRD